MATVQFLLMFVPRHQEGILTGAGRFRPRFRVFVILRKEENEQSVEIAKFIFDSATTAASAVS